MSNKSYKLKSTKLEDGRTYFVSDDLPGFRVLVGAEENSDEKIIEIFREFMPIYMASEARRLAPKIIRNTDNQSEVSMEFAPA
jgi:hypothetical protein